MKFVPIPYRSDAHERENNFLDWMTKKIANVQKTILHCTLFLKVCVMLSSDHCSLFILSQSRFRKFWRPSSQLCNVNLHLYYFHQRTTTHCVFMLIWYFLLVLSKWRIKAVAQKWFEKVVYITEPEQQLYVTQWPFNVQHKNPKDLSFCFFPAQLFIGCAAKWIGEVILR